MIKIKLPYLQASEEASIMLVLGVNKIQNICQVISGGIRHSCPMKEINGELCFIFKNAWHPVAKYLSEHTEEFVRESGKVISRPLGK